MSNVLCGRAMKVFHQNKNQESHKCMTSVNSVLLLRQLAVFTLHDH